MFIYLAGSSTLRDLEVERGYLVTGAEEGSLCIVTLLLTGRATPYLHNGVVYVGDEEHYVSTLLLSNFSLNIVV